MSHFDTIDDKELTLYLVGVLPEDSRARLDEASITRDDIAWRLRAVENDLIDAYVRGELPPDLARAFRSSYLATPHRRRRVAIADALAKRTRASERSHTDRFTAHRWHLLAVAAAIGGIAIAGYFVAVPQTRGPGVPRVSVKRPEAAPHTAPAATPVVSNPDRAKAPRSTIALTLAAPTRGAGPIETLRIPGDAGRVVLRLQLDADDFAVYRAELRDLERGAVVRRNDHLSAGKGRDGTTVDVEMPRSELEAGTYSIELSGASTDGVYELIAAYTFRIAVSE